MTSNWLKQVGQLGYPFSTIARRIKTRKSRISPRIPRITAPMPSLIQVRRKK